MKKINLLTLLGIVIFLGCNIVNNGKYKNDSIVCAKIRKVDFDILTFADVDCDSFDSFFENFENQQINKKATINYLQALICKSNVASSKVNMNTRAKIYLISINNIDTICIDQFHMYRDGKYYDTPNELIDYLIK